MTAQPFPNTNFNAMKGVCINYIANRMRKAIPEPIIRNQWLVLHPDLVDVYQSALEKYEQNPARYNGRNHNGDGHQQRLIEDAPVKPNGQHILRNNAHSRIYDVRENGVLLAKVQIYAIQPAIVEAPPTDYSAEIAELRREKANLQEYYDSHRNQINDLVHQLAMKNKEIEALNTLLGLRTP